MSLEDFIENAQATGLLDSDLRVTGGSNVGDRVKAAYRRGSGTVMFTRAQLPDGAAVDFGAEVPSGSTYDIKLTDRGYRISARPVKYLPAPAKGLGIPLVGPLAPTINSVTTASQSVTVTFTRNADNGGSAVIEDEVSVRSTASGEVVARKAGASPITVSGLLGGQLVSVAVLSKNSIGPGIPSGPVELVVAGGGAATKPATPAAPVLTALTSAISVAYGVPADGGSALLEAQFTDINGVSTTLNGSPQTIAKTAGAPITGAVRFRNAVGWSDYSPQSNSVTPTSGAVTARLLNVGTNQRWLGGITGTASNPIPAATDTPESIFRQPTMIGSGDVSEVYLFWPTWGNGNNGDESLGAFQIHSSALEFSGATAKFTYGGQETRQVLEGEMTTIQGQSAPVAGVLSDPITSAQLLAAFGKNRLNRGDKVWKRGRMIRADRTVKYGISRLMSQDTTGQSFRFKADSVAAIPDVYGTGNMTMTRTGVVGTLFSEATGFDPILLGKYVNEAGVIVLGLLGASMQHAATDTGWTAPLNSGRGMMRATFDKDGVSNPYAGLVVAAAGNTLDDMNGTNKRSYCTAAWVTHMELSPGGNDLGSADATSDSAKYTSIQTQLRTLWADLRVINPTLKLCALSKPPSTVSTDGYTTDTNQTPGAEYGEGQKVELLYRDWLLSQVGIPGGLDAVIDPPAMHWPGKRWLWASATSTPAILGGEAVGVPANQNHPGTGQYKLISNDIRTFCGMPAWPNTP